MQKILSGGKVVPFRIHFGVISQEDLAEEDWLHRQAIEANKAWRTKRKQIRRALEAGALVEPGMRKAKLEARQRLVLR